MAEAIYSAHACALKPPIPSEAPSCDAQADLCGFPGPVPVANAAWNRCLLADPAVALVGAGCARPQEDARTLVDPYNPYGEAKRLMLDSLGKLRIEVGPRTEPMTVQSRHNGPRRSRA